MSIVINKSDSVQEIKERVVLVKPTVREILHAYINSHEKLDKAGMSYFEEDSTNQIINEWADITSKNTRYLSVMRLEDYNKKNFDMLIASIQLNGAEHFNMQLFMGVLGNVEDYDSYDVRSYGDNSTVHGIHNDFIEPINGGYSPFMKTTKAFNCDTIGCIAGFAVATALDWEETLIKKATKYSHNQQHLFENVACNFLNMPIAIGKKLFYAEGNSIWSMLAFKTKEFSNCSELDVFRALDLNSYDEEDHYYTAVELASINHEMAAKALELIKNGYVYLGEDGIPQLSRDYENIIRKSVVDSKEG